MVAKSAEEIRSALVLYGSETGNAHDIADELGRMLERLRFSTYVTHLDAVDPVCSPAGLDSSVKLTWCVGLIGKPYGCTHFYLYDWSRRLAS